KKTDAAPAKSQKTKPVKALEDSLTPLDRIMLKLTNSIEAGNMHPYLLDHEVANYDLSLDKDGNLLGIGVNLRESFVGDSYKPKPQTMLTISPEGKTTLEPGAKFFCSALMIGHQAFRQLVKKRLRRGDGPEIYVTVDYPTGAFLHMHTGKPVAVAFKNANIKTVVAFFAKKFPYSKVIACLNSEESKYASRDKAALEALRSGGLVTYPTFNKCEKFQSLCSFNDLGMVHGPDVALARLQEGIQGGTK
ncbi:hypothetical protein LJB99_04620, partial [Deltaproteobacteria bacterium OttesenSCG-928-K17]|nr:hypothetical protein [Deltaproteobacteria bacterium OttesenSCG-928-K17]